MKSNFMNFLNFVIFCQFENLDFTRKIVKIRKKCFKMNFWFLLQTYEETHHSQADQKHWGQVQLIEENTYTCQKYEWSKIGTCIGTGKG